jgi:hypothetical protein
VYKLGVKIAIEKQIDFSGTGLYFPAVVGVPANSPFISVSLVLTHPKSYSEAHQLYLSYP